MRFFASDFKIKNIPSHTAKENINTDLQHTSALFTLNSVSNLALLRCIQGGKHDDYLSQTPFKQRTKRQLRSAVMGIALSANGLLLWSPDNCLQALIVCTGIPLRYER